MGFNAHSAILLSVHNIGIKFISQGRNNPSDPWVSISTADTSDLWVNCFITSTKTDQEFLAVV